MSKILYVSSFNEYIYKVSGIKLIGSFIKNNIEGDLLITLEGNYSLKKYEECYENIRVFNLNTYDYLNNWLLENQDIIPIKYGGIFNSKHPEMDINIKLLNNYNQKASLWFRKIASLKYAIDMYKDDYDYIIWIDADTEFLTNMSTKYLINQFKNTYCFYHLGLSRGIFTLFSIESGFIGFKKGSGYELIQSIVDEYSNKQFMKYARWDDGHVMGQVIINSEIDSIDVINLEIEKTLKSIDRFMNPMRYGPFKKYIKHFKGIHHFKNKYDVNERDYIIIENQLLRTNY